MLNFLLNIKLKGLNDGKCCILCVMLMNMLIVNNLVFMLFYVLVVFVEFIRFIRCY